MARALTARAMARVRRLADVDEVDLIHAGLADADDRAFHDAHIGLFAGLGRHLLGIVQALGDALAVEDDGGRDHRPGQGAAPGFVHAGDGAGAVFQKARFEDVMRHGPAQRLPCGES